MLTLQDVTLVAPDVYSTNPDGVNILVRWDVENDLHHPGVAFTENLGLKKTRKQ